MIRLGDTVSVNHTETFGKGRRRGKVVYIHPNRRFLTAEFDLPGGGKVRESFQLFREKNERTQERRK